MSCKLFVANFPYSTTNEELNTLFGPHGQVLSVKIATDRETGRSRGFGFVEMGSEQEADNAIRELDGYQLGGRGLAVRVAEERSRPGGPGGPGGGPRGPRGPRSDGGGGGFGGPRGGAGAASAARAARATTWAARAVAASVAARAARAPARATELTHGIDPPRRRQGVGAAPFGPASRFVDGPRRASYIAAITNGSALHRDDRRAQRPIQGSLPADRRCLRRHRRAGGVADDRPPARRADLPGHHPQRHGGPGGGRPALCPAHLGRPHPDRCGLAALRRRPARGRQRHRRGAAGDRGPVRRPAAAASRACCPTRRPRCPPSRAMPGS